MRNRLDFQWLTSIDSWVLGFSDGHVLSSAVHLDQTDSNSGQSGTFGVAS